MNGPMRRAIVHVVAGVIKDHDGRVLVAQRPPGKHLAGYWEFPGGKIDPGETPFVALRRELAEEIGIEVHSAQPLIAVPWSYPEKRIVLDVWVVDEYSGIAHAREDQPLRWVDIEEFARLPMPAADAPIVAALRLPDRYLITPPLAFSAQAALLDGIERACAGGIHLIQLRLPGWTRDEIAATAPVVRSISSRHGTILLLNADWETAERCGLDGVHLPARIAGSLVARPVSADRWLAVSCHDAGELAHAQRIGADFATLAPVAPTPSHVDAAPLGWERFAACVADAALPVYALGGLGVADIGTARSRGAQGVAAIRAFWR